MKSLQGKVVNAEDKIILNRFEQQAKQDIEKVRSTPELEKAEQEAQIAWDECRTARQEVIRTSQNIGEGDPQQLYAGSPFSRAIRRVQIIDNEIKISEPVAPEVTWNYEKK